MSRLPRTTSRAALLALTFVLALPACRKSPTAKQIKGFADKVCACQDAACAEAIGAEYLEWREGNMRARGSDSDRKGVEKAMQRYAECHLKLVGPEAVTAPAAPDVPKVNLQPAPVEAAEAPDASAPGASAPSAPAKAPTPAAVPAIKGGDPAAVAPSKVPAPAPK